jgi:hypothetical protein
MHDHLTRFNIKLCALNWLDSAVIASTQRKLRKRLDLSLMISNRRGLET